MTFFVNFDFDLVDFRDKYIVDRKRIWYYGLRYGLIYFTGINGLFVRCEENKEEYLDYYSELCKSNEP